MGLFFSVSYVCLLVPHCAQKSLDSPHFFGATLGATAPTPLKKVAPLAPFRCPTETSMLTDTKIKQAKPTEKIYKLYDADGLYIEIPPKGSKRWRWKYRFEKKEKRLSLGLYPAVSLKAAREKRDNNKEILAGGRDPASLSKTYLSPAGPLFKEQAEKWYTMYTNIWAPSHAETVRRRMDNYILSALGELPLSQIAAPTVLSVLRPLEKRGIVETANRVLGIISTICAMSVAEGLLPYNPCQGLSKAITPARAKHHAALTKKEEVCGLMRAIESYMGSAVVRAAVMFTALTFVRQQELRFAAWGEISWDEQMWIIPAERMKMRRDHVVPLSRQAMNILKKMLPITGNKPLIFMGERGRPLSENTIRCALRSMGYSNDQMTAHGFRTMASTLLNEAGWRSDVIERQLAHVPTNSVRAAYNRAEYLNERREMMQSWSDFLFSLLEGTLEE